ncbi:hypothetical protein ES319_D12G267000v1 [Gossypium barbadense]|uniref:Branchless trichome n=2 Tax=Gossypium TaxID=3633 RepID=A0A5J5P3N4_GOSBA|nr:hypothetical protein ES319_D12G267000v1 [Gossypium barbadense]TYG42745.1 hypothetical protein ES288_D12G282300v1 [Gossypium darwinii]
MEEDMEMIMMMMINSSSSPNNQSNEASTSTSWKVYDNPFFNSHHHRQQVWQSSKHLHHHQVCSPVSAQTIVDPFWDLTLFGPSSTMDSELDIARAQIIDLQAELDYEVKARKKAESLNKKLAKDLAEERRGREALERVCDKLAREISLDKAEIDRMRRDFEEERKMLRMAEVLREERVQMKLAEAKFLFAEKLLELEETKRALPADKEDKPPAAFTTNLSGKFSRLVFSEKASSTCNDSSMAIQRKASPEAENPHIKRGIKGFVEFPRVVRAIGSKSKHWGSKLECQKAQLRVLLKQKSPIRSNNLIMS